MINAQVQCQRQTRAQLSAHMHNRLLPTMPLPPQGATTLRNRLHTHFKCFGVVEPAPAPNLAGMAARVIENVRQTQLTILQGKLN
jgi:hypothetical protein